MQRKIMFLLTLIIKQTNYRVFFYYKAHFTIKKGKTCAYYNSTYLMSENRQNFFSVSNKKKSTHILLNLLSIYLNLLSDYY